MQEPIRISGVEKQINPLSSFDSPTKKRIRKHLSDINDVITEDDIRNIRTDIYDIKKAAPTKSDSDKV
jgi:phage-related protein